jgi:hypothetical protein
MGHRSSSHGAHARSRCPQLADVNAFLKFPATKHTYTPEHPQGRLRVAQILEAAKAGHVLGAAVEQYVPRHRRLSDSPAVPHRDVDYVSRPTDLSEMNPLVELPHNVSVASANLTRVLARLNAS